MLLEAISILKNQGRLHEFLFLVVGDGELRDELIRAAERLKIGGAIVFNGWEKDMPAMYGAIDALVLTSRNEGTPVTIIEAMAAGRPVVATDVGGVRDLLGNVRERKEGGFSLAQRGILVSPDNPGALAEAFKYLQGNAANMSGTIQKARDFAMQTYSVKRMLADVTMLYECLNNE